MKPPIIIGIAGFAKAGKSTFAARLVERLAKDHLGAEIVPFAGPLKRGLAEMGIKKDESPDLYRIAAQRIGTDIVRRENPDHWVDLFERYVRNAPRVIRLEETADNGAKATYRDVIIADDVRFENEVSAIRRLGGIMVYVDAADRLGLVRKRRWGRGYALNRTGIWRHRSEDLAAKMWKLDFRIDVRVNANMPTEGSVDDAVWADIWIRAGVAQTCKLINERRGR
jgi:hypothetical protein